MKKAWGKKKKNPFLETTSYGGLSMTPKDICKILVQRWKYGWVRFNAGDVYAFSHFKHISWPVSLEESCTLKLMHLDQVSILFFFPESLILWKRLGTEPDGLVFYSWLNCSQIVWLQASLFRPSEYFFLSLKKKSII